MPSIHENDIFFISYDEPEKERFWEDLRQQLPHAQRVDGVKGFDAAYKRCEALASTERFFTIDGDNRVTADFFQIDFQQGEFPADAVLSWSSQNSVNGLSYGNGGIKNWPRATARNMRTHEMAQEDAATLDFCFQLNYWQMPQTLSHTIIHSTPFQAFRAGFREGAKMCLERGSRPATFGKTNAGELLHAHVAKANMDRLRIWCSVGSDVENGDWAIFGARMGVRYCCWSDGDLRMLRDYDRLLDYWRNEITTHFISHENDAEALVLLSENLGHELNENLGLGITRLAPEASRFFKSVYTNPRRDGRMYS